MERYTGGVLKAKTLTQRHYALHVPRGVLVTLRFSGSRNYYYNKELGESRRMRYGRK